jgi:nitrile hydratase beta subunit
MDGIHDVGGEQGFGPVKTTVHDPPFEHDWEARMLGIVRALWRPGDWNSDKFRFTREQLPPVEYLTRPYFDQWYRSYAAMLLGSGIATPEELATGRSVQPSPTLSKPMSAAEVATARKSTARFDRPYAGEPRLFVGDHVRAALVGSPGHTRLPRYVRGHVGVVSAVHGAHVVPDENAQGRSIAEPLYTVAFATGDLFPEQTGSGDKVHLDLWERYLQPIERN